MTILDKIRWNEAGLAPCIVQDAENGQVLMVAWMNREALQQTISTRRVTFWSRSRQEFWIKGQSSGHFQHLVELRVDCDADVLLARVRQEGVACHEGYRSCFFRVVNEQGELEVTGAPEIDPDEIYRQH